MCHSRWRKQIGMIDDHDECSGWMFLLVPAHPGCPRQILQSRKTVVCVCVMIKMLYWLCSKRFYSQFDVQRCQEAIYLQTSIGPQLVSVSDTGLSIMVV